MAEGSYEPTHRTTVRRKKDRGSYDRELVHGIFDEAMICHVAFVDDGQPYAIPTIHARVGETLYFHGSRGSRMLTTLREGAPCCVTASLIDELVLTRAGMHHSMNYRSVMVLGTASRVEDPDEKQDALRAVVDHIAAGRSDEVRGPDAKELRGTEVLRMPIEEASAKHREGPGMDDDEDLSLPYWAGTLPLNLVPGEPVPDETLADGVPVPEHLRGWSRRS